MRNKKLDQKTPEDSKIGKTEKDGDGREFRIINGKRIYQLEEKTQGDKDLNLIMNRVRASGMTPSEYLKNS